VLVDVTPQTDLKTSKVVELFLACALNLRPKGSHQNNFPILCADASCLAVLPKRRNISIFLRLGALPDRRLNT
jgi:hypothetical protein